MGKITKKNILINSANHDKALFFNSHFGRISYYSSSAPIKNHSNEDSFGILSTEDFLIIGVADGLGGYRGGDQASNIAIQSVLKNWSKKDKQNILESLISKIEKAHEEIKNLKLGAGSTIVLAVIKDEKIRFLSIGDSTGYLVSGQKNFKFKTLEQSPVGLAVEAGMIDENAALDHEESNMILNVLGQDPLRIELTGELDFSDRDYALLTSDGLTSNLVQDEIFNELSLGEDSSPLDSLALKARQKMNDGGNPDDLTMILFMR